MMQTDGKFYLGKLVDPQTNEKTGQPLLYDPADLTTHAIIVGMTGSGKTGLCLDLMEEAALNRIPAIMIDPKGDITNALLHFPDLAPADFQPWINADAARREGKTAAQAAADMAALWRNGLAKWDITPERIQKLKESVRFAIYTPGSDAGLPISILASLKAPPIPWEENKELLREKISGTVTAVLGLVGFKDIDPVRSREHILLANIFETAWSRGQDLDLGELIMQVQTPPFEKLGVFDINRFFPEKDRFDLAIRLNNILAAPAFQAWTEGEPLDVGRLLYEADGTPRHTIFYIAHLNDEERMFFVTLLYSAVESWMRTQSGATSLRALVYFDEIFGYLPPVGNPPSKEPMLRLLKQARAFGVGLALATQNPADIDYKALSNAGTWFIGKLGTDQDKQRLLDGLTSAAGAGLDRRQYDDLISAIDKRVFLLRNVHEKEPTLFQTRWAMNYLAGPATRAQIPALNVLAGVSGQLSVISERSSVISEQSSVSSPQSPDDELLGTASRPTVPGRTAEYFLPVNRTPPGVERAGLLYRPALLARADIRFLNRKYGLDEMVARTAVVHEPDRRGMVRWDDFLTDGIESRDLEREPVTDGRFAGLEEPLADAKLLKSLQTDFVDWAYRGTEVTVKANEKLKVYAGPDVSDEEFARLCQKAAAEKAEVEADKVEAQFERKLDSLEKKLTREERELSEDESEYKQRKMEEAATHAETLFSLFSKRRKSISSSMTKRRMTARAREDIEESKDEIAQLKQDIDDLEAEMKGALDELEAEWDSIAADVTEITVTPYKKDVHVSLFGVVWVPYHLVGEDGRLQELPGFRPSD